MANAASQMLASTVTVHRMQTGVGRRDHVL
jgi:hypothetical protein